MAQSMKRASQSGPARSASSPPGLTMARLPFLQMQDGKSPAHSSAEPGRSNTSEGQASAPVGLMPSSSILSVSTTASGTRTPIQRAATSTNDAPDHREADFVQGGIELPPAPELGACEEGEADFATRPLPQLGDPILEEFWPAGEGLRALFLDYDGTLREFESKPELATPTQEVKELLSAINSRQDFCPHIISGRDAAFLEANFGYLDRFTLIAEHGFQIWRPGAKGWVLCDHPDGLDKDHDDWKVVVRDEMTRFVTSTPGSFIEEKASSLVWHYREVKDAAAATETAAHVVERLEEVREQNNIGKIRISHGHCVVEVSYRKVRKGPVMRRVCEEKALFGSPFLSVFVAGDDTWDESMFDIAPDDFLTVKVGPALTHAKFRVDSPAQLRRFLWQLAGG